MTVTTKSKENLQDDLQFSNSLFLTISEKYTKQLNYTPCQILQEDEEQSSKVKVKTHTINAKLKIINVIRYFIIFARIKNFICKKLLFILIYIFIDLFLLL